MSVASVKDPALKAVADVVPAIADISKLPIRGFFLPEDEVHAMQKAWEEGKGEIGTLNLMPGSFDEGAAYYYTSR